MIVSILYQVAFKMSCIPVMIQTGRANLLVSRKRSLTESEHIVFESIITHFLIAVWYYNAARADSTKAEREAVFRVMLKTASYSLILRRF